MNDIFISYARSDREKAKAISEALERRGYKVWWDPKIRLGEPFSPAIKKALQEASAVVVLWSRASARSSWVIDEARIAAKRHVLLPVLIERVTPPDEFAQLDCANLAAWDPQKPHPEFDQLRRLLLSLFPREGGHAVSGHWQVERLNKDTLAVTLDYERHTVQYSKGHVYVDGELVASSSAFDPAAFDISTDKPLRIGFGPHDYFRGRMRDVKLYACDLMPPR